MTKTDIIDTINRRLLEKWPNRTVYVDVCPIDFERPSFWLSVEKFRTTDANRFLMQCELRIRLTLYDELDEHYDASWYRLSKETDEAEALLAPVLKVADRHIKLNLQTLPRDPDRAYIQIDTSWMDKRPGLDGEDASPVADSYSLKVRGTIK